MMDWTAAEWQFWIALQFSIFLAYLIISIAGGIAASMAKVKSTEFILLGAGDTKLNAMFVFWCGIHHLVMPLSHTDGTFALIASVDSITAVVSLTAAYKAVLNIVKIISDG